MAGQTIESPRQAARTKVGKTTAAVPLEVAGPWIGRQFACSAAEETAFVDELEILSGHDEVNEFERRDVTVLVTALRCGLTPSELTSQAPGVRPARLLAAHRELETRRMLSEHAWRTISLDRSLLAFETFAACAAELLPAVISHLAAYRHDAARYEAALVDATEQVQRTGRRVHVLEQRVAESADDPVRARELGTLLYDIYGQGAWSLPSYLPTRVGTLVPLRVGALLGDDITATRRVS